MVIFHAIILLFLHPNIMSTHQQRSLYGRSGGFIRRSSGHTRGNVRGNWKSPSMTEPPSPTRGPVLAIIDDEDLAGVSGIKDPMAKIAGYTEVA